MKKFLALLLAMVALFSFASCASISAIDAEDAVFTSNGLEITLTEAFEETSYEGFTVCYDSFTAAVFALEEKVSELGDMTVEEYADLVYKANAASNPEPITVVDGIPCMEFSAKSTEDNKTYQYLATMYKSDDAYWLIQFSCVDSNYEEYKPHFMKWAKSVKFTEG